VTGGSPDPMPVCSWSARSPNPPSQRADRQQTLHACRGGLAAQAAISDPIPFFASCCRNVALAQLLFGAMAGKTHTRADLYEAVYKKAALTRTECATLVELVLKEITDCLERGETVKLSSFGSFVVRKKGQRIGRNPKTGKEVPISPRRVVVFKPSAILKQRINGLVGKR